MSSTPDIVPQLLALDWGTSSLRAFLMHDGQVIDTRHSAHGIQHLPLPGRAGFEQAFAAIAGDWVRHWPQLPVVASGMVGSAQGWREAPYVRCPATVKALAEQNTTVASGLGQEILIAPGVLYDEPGELPDVMRGEEIQIAGALLQNPQWSERSCILLPGTHSKWVQIEDGKIVRFATYLTGELFAVLSAHSILGRLLPAASEVKGGTDVAAFELGLANARRSGPGELSHQLFGTRTLGLTGRLAPAALADYLSGLLIGHELVSGLSGAGNELAAVPLVMIGEPSLCQRYVRSLEYMDQAVSAVLDNTAPVGLWNFAGAARLLARSTPGTE
ncbi:MAG: 2-keto-3-deoxy-galactonokinase [Proteobacteria bacterium]|nr:2-keto-3-deoxy-galactonokinase [Pseudomonadota bacterium]